MKKDQTMALLFLLEGETLQQKSNKIGLYDYANNAMLFFFFNLNIIFPCEIWKNLVNLGFPLNLKLTLYWILSIGKITLDCKGM